VAADDEALGHACKRCAHALVRRDASQDLLVAPRRAVTVEDAVEDDSGRQPGEEVARERVELCRYPLAELPIGVATHEERLVAHEELERLSREWPGHDIAAADDPVDLQRRDLRKHCLERGQVAVHVVQRRDAH
jgi:hypothetical protein